MSKEIYDREADFHDAWADSTPLEEIDVREAFETVTAPENLFILQEMGALAGKRVLDIGVGLGESSVYFALQGAKVTATDISPRMVELALRLGKLHGVEIEGVVSAAETLGVPEGSFDFVNMGNVLHHVSDREQLWRNVHQALKPGGRFFSWDPLGYNPVINIYRRLASEVRTEDETPLTRKDLGLARRYFVDVGHREFWILTLSLFLKYFLIDRVHPNADRYWKRILKEPRDRLWWFVPLQRLDQILTHVPGVRWLAWNTVMWGTKGPRQG